MRAPRLLLALLVALACAACVRAASPDPALNLSADPFLALPGAQDPLGRLVPYRFRDQGAAALERFEARSSIERLVFARALIDALLFGELTQDRALLDRLAGQGELWPLVERALRTGKDDDEAVERALKEGRALAQALKTRGMDAPYHAALMALAEQGGAWEVEARAAMLLDLDEAVGAVASLPADQRGRQLVAALGPRVCARPERMASAQADEGAWQAGLEAACDLRCGVGAQELELAPEGVRGALSVASCGYEAAGWSLDSAEGVWTPELAVVLRIFSQIKEIEWLEASGHPLAVEAAPSLVALRERLSRAPVALPIGAQSAGALGLELVEGGGEGWGAGVSFVRIDAQGLRVGLVPLVAATTQGGRGLEGRFGFPGRLVAGWEELGDPQRSGWIERRLSSEVEDAAELLGACGVEGGGPWVLMVDARLGAQEVLAALGRVRRALAGGRMEAGLLLWEAGRGLRAAPLGLIGSVEGAGGGLEGFPSEVRPLDLRLRVGAGTVEIVARGEVMERLEGAGVGRLGERLSGLREEAGGALTVEGSGGGSFGSLVEALSAAWSAGYRSLSLSTTR